MGQAVLFLQVDQPAEFIEHRRHVTEGTPVGAGVPHAKRVAVAQQFLSETGFRVDDGFRLDLENGFAVHRRPGSITIFLFNRGVCHVATTENSFDYP
jgi:hypothetical protein